MLRTLANKLYETELTEESVDPLIKAFEISFEELKADFNNYKALGFKSTIFVGSNSEVSDILGLNHILSMQNRFSLKYLFYCDLF